MFLVHGEFSQGGYLGRLLIGHTLFSYAQDGQPDDGGAEDCPDDHLLYRHAHSVTRKRYGTITIV